MTIFFTVGQKIATALNMTAEPADPGEGKNKKVTAFVLLGVTFLFFSSAGAVASAETLSPWWHITSGSRPSNIQPGTATDAVQQLTVSAGSGSYILLLAKIGESQREIEFTAGAEPGTVQAALEGSYGAGAVEVTSPCTMAPNPSCTKANNEYEVYEVKFVGALEHRYAQPLQPAIGAVTVKQLAEGRPDGVLVVTVENVGDTLATASKAPVEIVDSLPKGLRATGATAITPVTNSAGSVPCALQSAGARVSCKFSGIESELPDAGGEKSLGGLPPYQEIELRIPVETESSLESGELNEVSISGGEGSVCESESEPVFTCERVSTGPIHAVSIKRPVRVSAEAPGFGVEDYELTPEAAGGALDTQAGSHPFETNFTTVLNQDLEAGEAFNEAERPVLRPVALAKDLRFKLPPGLVGNPTAIPQCTIAQFLQGPHNPCPADTAIGVASVTVNVPGVLGGYNVFIDPVFNLEPQHGEPARFGFYITAAEFGVYIDTSVRTGGDYGVTSTTSNISQTASFVSADVSLWGTPGDQRHDQSRGWSCLAVSGGLGPCTAPDAVHPPPLLDLPTSCTGPLQTSAEGDSWAQPGVFSSTASEPEPALDGCNQLPFGPEIKVSPDGQQASKPTGLTVDVHVPQEGQLNGEGLAQSNVKNIMVTLPPGVILNPSAANGLEGCTGDPADRPGGGQLGGPGDQIGFEGVQEFKSEPGSSAPAFTPYLPDSTDALAAGYGEALQPGTNFCPNASKIAEATIKTPLLPNPVKGFVYLASPQNFGTFPQENPFSKHVAMYIVAEDEVSGSLVKLPGRVELGGEPGVEGLAPGQIRSTFEDNPQLPFEDAELHFFGGERAPLASPTHCGAYTTDATFTPWSGGEAVDSSSTFQITSGPNGTACPGPALPFSASLASGTTNNNAGSFTPLTTTLSREDGQQPIQSVTLHYPPGLSGLLSSVELCPEAQANAGTCGPNSQIGETIVSVGVGGDPFTVTGGKAYITGPYDGAPFGLSIVNPAKAGPFDLQEGRPVVVRAKIEVNPTTAALTIATDPSGAHAIPTMIEGFPLQIQHVNVLVNRPGFTFNPTNCTPTNVTGTIDSAEGAASEVKDPFQVTNCASLKFTPKFNVSTVGHTSKALGASLTAKVTEPGGGGGQGGIASLGTQANIARVKVDLPLQLPSQLKTLQKACPAKTFEEGFEQCLKTAPDSKIGEAVVHTPLLPVPLKGPAIFVSHGGEAFPSLTIVLQGYGVTVDLVGSTFIHGGITSTTFKTVPDTPFSTFELTIPQGKYAALAANLPEKDKGNLCGQNLKMPTEFLAQNGAKINEDAQISITGCPKAKTAAQLRAAKLAAALKACHKKHGSKRSSCEKAARKRYNPLKKKPSKKK
jgi:hypothetical protein